MAGKEKEKGKEKEREDVDVETPTKKPAEAKKPSIGDEAKAKGKGKEAAKEAKAESDIVKGEPVLSSAKADSEQPAKASTSPKIGKKPAQSPSKGAAATQTPEAKEAPVTPGKLEPSKGRKHPGKLDITAAVEKTPDQPAAQVKAGAAETDTPTAAAQTPSKAESPGAGSPALKNAPRTLRLVQTPTPKAETPPVSTAPPAEKPKDAVPAAVRVPSRQPSVASIQNLPGTPSSEQVSISDNISTTSASQSRANSPPPSSRTAEPAGVGGSKIVGSAPVRQKTKAQAKKDRQERAKQIEEEKAKAEAESGAGAAKAEDEAPQQEAIVSRKKKAKKEKPAPAPKPPQKSKEQEEAKSVADKTASASRAPSPTFKPDKGTTSAKTSKPSTPTKAPSAPQPEPSPPPTPTLTAAQIIADLKATAPEIQKSLDSLLRTSPTSSNHSNANGAFKPPHPISAQDLANPKASWRSPLQFQLSKDDIEALLSGKADAKRFGGDSGRVWDRGLVSPGGAELRALGAELEKRFLELERAIRELPDELRFRPTKPGNETKFPHVDLEALKREMQNAMSSGGVGAVGGVGANSGRGASAMEQMVHDGSGARRGAFLLDEVGKYINEFVMPPATPPPPPPPPPSTTTTAQQQAQGQVQQGHGPEAPHAAAGAGAAGAPGGGLEIAERMIAEARRVSEEREGALRKVVKKNRKVLGLG